jgi:thiol:disulfide interchange protein DsbC
MKINRSLFTSILLSGLMLTNVSCAADSDKGPQAKDLDQRWTSVLDGAQITEVRPSPINGIWEVQAGPHIFYTNEAGDKLIIGDIITMEKDAPVNLTEQERGQARLATIKALNPEDFIVYAAKKPKHNLYVFTDADCVYCRKFHEQRQELMDAGITINYIAMPRTPPGSPSYKKSVAIWCAKDRQAAFNEAVKDELKDVETSCEAGEKIVAADVTLARNFGVSGTPALIFEDGTLVPGFLPAAELINYFDEQDKASSK